MVTTHSSLSLSMNMVSKGNVQDQDDAGANKSPDALQKVNDQAPPDTDATLPVPTHILAI